MDQVDDLLDVHGACKFIGGSKPINSATLWRGVREGRYAQPIKISKQSVRWKRSELAADIERMAAARQENTAA